MKDSFLEEIVDASFEIYGKSPIIEKGIIYGIGIKEWIKWLSYNSTENEKYILVLINKYVNQNCTKEEFYKVYDYMSNSIENIMLKKLNSDELKEANDKVKRLEQLSDKELRGLIDTEIQDDIYYNLSMIDDGGLYNEAKYKIGSTKIFDEMKIYMDTINEFGSDKKISTLKKGIRVNLDAFKPSRKEGKVKKKTYAR